MQKILVSACFLGHPVRYNGTDLNVSEKAGIEAQAVLNQWSQEGRVVSVCPEVSGGLPTPRAPAEINIDGRVIANTGQDVTHEFIHGANHALDLCRQHNIKIAVMTESSPSCGSGLVYDGSFSNTKISGQGVTAALLSKHGIKVFSQFSIKEAQAYLSLLEA